MLIKVVQHHCLALVVIKKTFEGKQSMEIILSPSKGNADEKAVIREGNYIFNQSMQCTTYY